MEKLYQYGVSLISSRDDEYSDSEIAPMHSDSERAPRRGDHENRRRAHSSHRPSSHMSISVSSRGCRRPDGRPYETRSPSTPPNSESLSALEHANIELRARLEKTEGDLAAERSLHEQTRKEQGVLRQSLDDGKVELKQMENDKERWKRMAGDRKKQLRETTRELNRFISSTQGFSKMDDSEFHNKAEQLRGDIRNITLCHLATADELDISDSTYALFKQRLRLPESILGECLQSSSIRPEIVQAFLWETLRADVFSRFRWVPQLPAEAMNAMSIFLAPFQTPESEIVPDAKRKFHTWRATTTNIMMECLALDQEQVMRDASKLCQEQAKLTANDLSDLLQPLHQGVFEELLVEIFDQTLVLSEMIDTQLASITWSDSKRKHKTEAHSEKGHPRNDKAFRLIVAPGLMRRGKSSGDSFDVEEIEILPPLVKLVAQRY
ncbi:hypothetical protein N7457_003928 [Penicillium paradoxum]|uniref:uncharacterized protein n=1 Tax=Penicillium paradoxum TaxID=176176 RepID=UPI0025469B7E|nr:uncharacterized protein N7457_003928 [Penicillium paradoxum]KAJ5782154.1 hypothetical protein N7457_003928 [Penicillium paradoxum]